MQASRQLSWVTLVLVVVLPATVCGAQSDAVQDAKQPYSSAMAIASRPASDQQFAERNSRYKIGAGDSFEISFELTPEFNQTAVTVQPDGFITLRGIGDLKVDGQTVPELKETLKTAYGRILNDPVISVVLKDFEKPYFMADGQVGRPGKYDLRGSVTLTQAIAMAGGFTDTAKHSQVLLFRRVSDQWMQAKIINVKKMEKAGVLNEDPVIHPGDMVFVPKNAYSKIKPFIPTSSIGTYIRPY